MAHLLLYYGSTEGQTRKIARYMADVMRQRGHIVTLADGEAASARPEEMDAIVVGGSLHAGRHQRSVRDFVRRHREALSDRPSAFFSVSLTAALGDERHQAEIDAVVQAFLDEVDWHPDEVATIGGALRYTQYGFLKRFLMKQISRRNGGPTDTSRDYEFTDWDRVRAFVKRLLDRVERADTTPSARV